MSKVADGGASVCLTLTGMTSIWLSDTGNLSSITMMPSFSSRLRTLAPMSFPWIKSANTLAEVAATSESHRPNPQPVQKLVTNVFGLVHAGHTREYSTDTNKRTLAQRQKHGHGHGHGHGHR